MPLKVLAIDDDFAMTDMLDVHLATYGFMVRTANQGEAGVKLVHEFQPDVVILDLMMPGMNGWEVCAEIRQFSRVPILILSALDNPGNVANALDAGADDYLVKPVPSGVLIAHITTLARRVNVNNHDPFISPLASAASL
jgi:DNA-binding response OmpR family regulator